MTSEKEGTSVSALDIGDTRHNQDHTPDDGRRIKIGLLVWALIWIINKVIFHLALLLLPDSSYETVELLLKALDCIVRIALIVYTIRNWHWSLNDWGFTYDSGFWVVLVVIFIYVGYFWYGEGLPAGFDIRTVRQALTGIWEELISTVFLTLLLDRYFQIFHRLRPQSAKILAVVISAVAFALLHYGRWDVAEASVNVLSFIAYRAVYAFAGTFLAGLVIHGVSNGQFMAFPLLLAFYGVIAFFNWRETKKHKV
jgi:hypothetical protein